MPFRFLSGAGVGAATGARWGPWGVALGAGLGGLISLFAPRSRRMEGTAAPETRQTIRAAVSPRRWLLGRVRVGGQMVFAARDGYDLHLVYVLGEGRCDALERVWVGGRRIELARRSRGAESAGFLCTPPAGDDLAGSLAVVEYFAADGRGGDSIRSVVSTWTPEHRLDGVSYVHVWLRQTAQLRWTAEDGIPEMEFGVRGLRFRTPGSVEPTWTASAAVIRHWWLTERRGVSPGLIDFESYVQAHAACEVELPRQVAAGQPYAAVGKRYQVDGVVRSTDRSASVEEQLDWCWQGSVVQAKGLYVFRPGVPPTGSAVAGSEEVVGLDFVRVGQPVNARRNGMRATLPQDAARDWTESSVEYVDAGSVELDGGRRLAEIGERNFVSDAYAAGRLIAVALRRLRARVWRFRLLPPMLQAQADALQVGNRLRLSVDYEAPDGSSMTDGVISRLRVNPDWTMDVELSEVADGLYEDTAVMPDGSVGQDGMSATWRWGGGEPWGGEHTGTFEWGRGPAPGGDPVLLRDPAFGRSGPLGLAWDGLTGWPFGAASGDAWWASGPIDAGGAVSAVSATARWFSPPGVDAGSVETPTSVQVFAAATEAGLATASAIQARTGGSSVDVPDGTRWLRLRVPFGGTLVSVRNAALQEASLTATLPGGATRSPTMGTGATEEETDHALGGGDEDFRGD